MSNIDQIEECSSIAREEAKQVNQLKDIITTWKHIVATDEKSLIWQWDQELQALLVQDRSELIYMKESKYTESIKDQIAHWHSKLTNIEESTKN